MSLSDTLSASVFGKSGFVKTDEFISPLHLSLIMSSALHWKSDHCSQCSTRFSRIWPVLHLWLYPLLPLLLRAHWPLCSSLTTWAYSHSSIFYSCYSLCLRGSSPFVSLFNFTFCLYIIFSVSPSQLPDLITESTPSFESTTLYFLFLVYFFSKAFVCYCVSFLLEWICFVSCWTRCWTHNRFMKYLLHVSQTFWFIIYIWTELVHLVTGYFR